MLEITGIAENYLNHYVYMNANAYKETYDLRAPKQRRFPGNSILRLTMRTAQRPGTVKE